MHLPQRNWSSCPGIQMSMSVQSVEAMDCEEATAQGARIYLGQLASPIVFEIVGFDLVSQLISLEIPPAQGGSVAAEGSAKLSLVRCLQGPARASIGAQHQIPGFPDSDLEVCEVPLVGSARLR